MKIKLLHRILFVLALTILTGIVLNAEKDAFEKGTTFAVVVGSLAITKTTDTASTVVFDTMLEDFPGGANLNRARLQTGTLEIKAGTLLYVLDGAAEIIKTMTGIAGGTATAIRVNKMHQFVVGEHIMITSASTAQTITAIDTSNADYDVVTIATSMGTTPGAGTVIVEAAAQGTTPVTKYIANAVLRETVDTERANPGCSGVVRGSVRSDALPYGAYAGDISALSLIRFV